MFRAIALACVFSASVPAWACQTLLRSPLLKISSNYTLSRQAENALRRMDISHAAFHRLAESQQSFVLGESSRFWTIIFRTDRRHLDEGILVTGWRNGKQFNIEEAFRSRPRDESDYFKEVARRHGMQTKVVQLKKNILNCNNVYVQSWIQAKLWLKHHINPDAIDEVLNNASEPEEDFRHAASGRRFVMQTQASDLRLRIVLADDGPCPHPLITAFEIH